MFPLGSVLLPSMPLQLRIFEPRYLKLLGDLVASDKPEFGVVLIERGQEVGGGEKRMEIGTLASVSEIGTTEDFLGLQSVGSSRFRVNAWLPDDPYPIADVDFLPDLIWDDTLMPSRVHLETKVRQLLAFVSEFGDLQYGSDTELSSDPMESCWQLAGILPVGPLDQVDLLACQSAEELIAKTYEMAVAAEKTLQAIMEQQADESD
jgi:Lon protease-like protein